jgi:hypothetical protein
MALANASYAHENSGTWLVVPGNFRSGSFDAPVLYAAGAVHVQRNLYEPHTAACATVVSGNCDAPVETVWSASMRVARHSLESILLGGGSAATTTPWIELPGAFGAPENYVVTQDDCIRLLCMLRAKNIQELLVWGNDDYVGDRAARWSSFKAAYGKVYTPRLTDVEETIGDPESDDDPEMLRRTNFVDSAPFVCEVASKPSGGQEKTGLVVTFEEMDVNPRPVLRVIVEGWWESDDAPAAIYGKLHVFNYDSDTWDPLPWPDHAVVSSVPSGDFAAYTPDLSMRRTIDFDLDALSLDYTDYYDTGNDGEMRLKFTHYSDEPFHSFHDLVQVVWIGEPSSSDP